MKKRHIYKLMQGGVEVARVEASTATQALCEATHYAMIYANEGPVTIVRVWS